MVQVPGPWLEKQTTVRLPRVPMTPQITERVQGSEYQRSIDGNLGLNYEALPYSILIPSVPLPYYQVTD